MMATRLLGRMYSGQTHRGRFPPLRPPLNPSYAVTTFPVGRSMLRTVFLTLLVLLIAIGGGADSVSWMLDRSEGFGALRIGPWTAFPDYGTANADPYSRARIAREPQLSLGTAEGLSFVAQRDSTNVPLRRQCTYRIEGSVPTTRFWTLHALDAFRATIRPAGRRPAALHSYDLLRRPDQTVEIAVSRHPAPGNWLAIPGSGAMSLVLTLYDTPIAGGSSFAGIALPKIVRVSCDG